MKNGNNLKNSFLFEKTDYNFWKTIACRYHVFSFNPSGEGTIYSILEFTLLKIPRVGVQIYREPRLRTILRENPSRKATYNTTYILENFFKRKLST